MLGSKTDQGMLMVEFGLETKGNAFPLFGKRDAIV